MAWPPIVSADFTGILEIPQTDFDTRLQAFIDLFYPKYARQIVGQGEYSTIDTTDPLPTKYDTLTNGGEWIDKEGDKHYFDGLVYAIKRLIYYEYVSESFTNSLSGMARAETENAGMATAYQQGGYAAHRWNQAALVTDDGEDFIKAYTDRSVDIDGIAGVTITFSSTELFTDGDTITIEGMDYTVSNVTSTTLDTNTAAPATSTKFKYTIFDEDNYCALKALV